MTDTRAETGLVPVSARGPLERRKQIMLARAAATVSGWHGVVRRLRVYVRSRRFPVGGLSAPMSRGKRKTPRSQPASVNRPRSRPTKARAVAGSGRHTSGRRHVADIPSRGTWGSVHSLIRTTPRRLLRLCRLTPSRFVIVLVLLLLIAGGSIWESRRLNREISTHISASFSQIGNIQAVFGSQPNGGISPACGCAHPKSNEWRGVTFTGRAVTLTRSGRSPWTEWVMSGPQEDPISLYDSMKRLEIRVIRFRLRGAGGGGDFDPRWLRDPSVLRQHADVQTDRPIRSHVLKLINHGSLHVDLTGPVPVGAWIPVPGSHISLGADVGAFQEEPSTLNMTEKYPGVLGQQTKNAILNREGYPLGDFLGPNVVVWSDDPSTESPGTPLARPGGRSITAVVISKSTFSVRIGAVPLSSDERTISHAYYQAVPQFRARESIHWGGADGGVVNVQVTKPLTPGQYVRLRRRVTRHPTVEIKSWEDRWIGPMTQTSKRITIPGQSVAGEYYMAEAYPGTIHDSATGPRNTLGDLDFEVPKGSTPNHGYSSTIESYPPLPSVSGFNVFGPLTHLRIANAVGSVLVGDRTIALGSPATVEFRVLKGLEDAQHRHLIAVPVSTAENQAKIQLTAVAGVEINGQDETSYAHQHSEVLSTWLFIFGLVSCLCSVAGLLWRFIGRD